MSRAAEFEESTPTESSKGPGKVPSKESGPRAAEVELPFEAQIEAELNATEDDLCEARERADSLSLEETRQMMRNVLLIHEHDPNFPFAIIERIQAFLRDEEIFEDPEKHALLIREMKLEAALITVNSPYSEVRAVVDNHDDVNIPCGTVRAWMIGMVLSVLLAFINQLFSIRKPPIHVDANVAQLLAFPMGKFCEKTLPDVGVTLFGIRHSLNPGRFSKKEHMLITIMATVAATCPYTKAIVWVQYLPQFFNQAYAGQFSYQIVIALATNFVGYGMAGAVRRFLVYPSYCVWPASLTTIALNYAFHQDKNNPVESPFGKIFTISRMKFFIVTFSAMAIYYGFPYYVFTALSVFSWISWIAPDNVNLSTITGMTNGLGINPWPTFDWNILLFERADPLMVPFFSTFNRFLGMFISMFFVAGFWYANTWNTGHLPINSNQAFDNRGKLYNVSMAVNSHGHFDRARYESYSPPFLTAGALAQYLFYFSIYTSMVSYAYLYHRHEIMLGVRNLIDSIRRKGGSQSGQYQDVHNRLMSKYKEVPGWWYTIVLVTAVGLGCAGIASWETYTSPAVVFYGLFLCVVFVIPIGVIKAITGIEVTLNVLAEFIGGSLVEGNALAMNFYKAFGYVTCAHAVQFSNDLKLAHYVKIPPRQTFFAQIFGTLISTFICTGVLNFQLHRIEGVCTPHAQYRFTCPGVHSFFAAAVLWGTVGPRKVFGSGGLYTALLVGFPVGFIVPIILYFVQKKYRKAWLRQFHPVAMFSGALGWSPYNISYFWPSVPIAWFSWVFLKKRYLAFWSKYNFVLSASFSTAIAIVGVVIFFALQWRGIELKWWGNDITTKGCEGEPCTRLKLGKGEYFGPRIGEFH